MEEERLPWWKRALRAAIGGLKSGFGLFGKTQPELVAEAPMVRPVEVRVDEVAAEKSIERSEPVVAEEPVVEEVIEEEPAAETAGSAAEEVEIAAEEERATADLSAFPSTRFTLAGFVQDDSSLEQQPVGEIEAEEKIAVAEINDAEEFEDEEEVIREAEPAELDIKLVEFKSETKEIEAESEAVVGVEPAEVLEEQQTARPTQVRHEDTIEVVPEVEDEGIKAVEEAAVETVEEEPVVSLEDDVQIESDGAEPVEEELQFEVNEQEENLSEDQQDASGAESMPELQNEEPQNEIEEMKSLQEEKIPKVEMIDTESQSGAEAPACEVAHEPEIEVEVPAVEVETAKEAAEPAMASVPGPVAVIATAASVEQPAVKHAVREDDDKSSPFSIIVSQVYEGPMDLLLDLIRKQDIDIYDIPIAKITEQFLTYVERLRASDMDMAGEFIYTASLLIHIKSKTLLPRAPSGQDDGYDDPRRELVERLLEHERFKNAAAMLQQKQILEDATWTNPGIREFKGDAGTEPELAADMVDLVRVFREILDRARSRPVINVEEDSVTVGQMIQFLGRRLNMEDRPIALHKLLMHTHSQRALVAMFLALLELVRLQAILLRQDKLFSEIFIKKSDSFDAVMTEGFLAARDDWN